MATGSRLTLPQLAGLIGNQFKRDIPVWKIRRVVDDLNSRDRLDVQRVGNYRTVSEDDAGIVSGELKRIGWFDREAIPC